MKNLGFVLLCLCVSVSVFAGKRRCKVLFDKMHGIQVQQRNGYSVKKGISLQKRADNAQVKWWRCENTLNKGYVGKKKASSRKKNKRKIKITKSSSIKINKRVKPVFSDAKIVVIKSRFHGLKQQAWLDYYQQPERCRHPKNSQVFAFCVENRMQQQQKFARQY